MTHTLRTVLAVCTALVVVALVAAFLPSSRDELQSAIDIKKVTLPELKKLEDRTIISYERLPDGSVSYAYLDKELPPALVLDEVVELRTPTSVTSYLGSEGKGEEEKIKLNTIIYPQAQFAQTEDGVWRGVEYATTSREAWVQRPKSLYERLSDLIAPIAYAVTDTVYSAAGDGHAYRGQISTGTTQWGSNRSASTAGGVDSTSTVFTVGSDRTTSDCEGPCTYQSDLWRGYVPFDTSSISASASISAVTLNLYVTGTNNNNDGSDYITVSTSTQATHTTLSTTDYNKAGALTINTGNEVIDSSERKDITSITASTYLTFTFNSVGRSSVKLNGQSSTCSATTGITCIALREGHDAVNVIPTEDAGANIVNFSSSEASGLSQDPYLSVTYTVPGGGGAAGRGGVLFPRGTLQINSGGLNINP